MDKSETHRAIAARQGSSIASLADFSIRRPGC
jgi:hypothetical protein